LPEPGSATAGCCRFQISKARAIGVAKKSNAKLDHPRFRVHPWGPIAGPSSDMLMVSIDFSELTFHVAIRSATLIMSRRPH
jgi:hypothetical protein